MRCVFYPYLPWEPFRRYVDRYVEHHANDGALVANLREVAEAVGATFAQMRRASSSGQVGFHAADQWACRLGVHPCVIWGEDYWSMSDRIDAHVVELEDRRRERRRKVRVSSEVCV